MTSDNILILKMQIENLRATLNETYFNSSEPYSTILTLSQTLDTLIAEYQRLLLGVNSE